MPAITVDGLRKSYGPVEALRGVSFEVAEGEIYALLGPNGAGKTTAVEILEGYRHRSSGDVQVLGFDPHTGGRAFRERIGIVLQEAAVEPYLTAGEVLERNAGYYPRPRGPREVLELVGLADRARIRVKTLSGGQLRRLDLALALVGRPDLVFLDEPTTGFDPSARRDAWELVARLRDLGTTVLLTTHYMDEAQHLADRVGVIVNGLLVAEGPPDTLGGRDTAAVRIRFRLPPDTRIDELPVAASATDDVVEVVTGEPTRALYELTGWAVRRNVELPGLAVDRPSLEDVYLSLTDDIEHTT